MHAAIIRLAASWWVRLIAGLSMIIATSLLGYAVAQYQSRSTIPEIATASPEFCGDNPSELCNLRYDNYREAWKIGEALAQRNCMIATAESITVGQFAATFGQVKWAGLVLAGGLVSYNTSLKNALLGVAAIEDKRVINEHTAREMANGLRTMLRDVNGWQQRRDAKSRICYYLTFTGAATRWGEIEPRVHIGLADLNTPPRATTFMLRDGLKPTNYARRYNIQLAIRHGLRMLSDHMNAAF